MNPIYANVDWALLRQQKAALLQTIELFDGIVHLIDAVQDEAVNSGDFDTAAVFDISDD